MNIDFSLQMDFLDKDQETSPVKFCSAKKKMFSLEDCIICNHGRDCLTSTTSSGIQSLIRTFQLCKDDVYKRLLETCGDNLNNFENLQISYHRLCFQKYTSRTNLQHRQLFQESLQPTLVDQACVQNESSVTRSSNPIIWKNCLICGFRKHRGDKKLHVI